MLALHVFGPGRGESIVIEFSTPGAARRVLVVDAYATKPHDSRENNPVLGFQPGRFQWGDVKAVCLTHPHEDHFMGLAAVAQMTARADWIGPGSTPIDGILQYYDLVAKHRTLPHSSRPHARWVADSIRSLAEWSKDASPFQPVPGRVLNGFAPQVRFIAPSDEILQRYARELWGWLSAGITDESESVTADIHNLPSTGIVIDSDVGCRVMLLGDMIRESWDSLLRRPGIRALLEERKADVLKLPHHCSNGAITADLMDLICDPSRTRAVLTPYRLQSPPPHDDAIQLVHPRVRELWSTVNLPRSGPLWTYRGRGEPLHERLLDGFLRDRARSPLPPGDCRVSFEIDSSGQIRTVAGRYAHCIKASS